MPEYRAYLVGSDDHIQNLPSVIVCLRSIQETPAIIDGLNPVLAEQARDSGHSTPAIGKTPALRHPGRAGPAPDDGGAVESRGIGEFIPQRIDPDMSVYQGGPEVHGLR